tara:strand:- start:136 stop:336 length:201 start_codon:yes stop_codon:yes gene_type:complete
MKYFDLKQKPSQTSIEDVNKARSNKSSDINVLLNRIHLNKRNETKKKIYFSAIASLSLITFGIIIF